MSLTFLSTESSTFWEGLGRFLPGRSVVQSFPLDQIFQKDSHNTMDSPTAPRRTQTPYLLDFLYLKRELSSARPRMIFPE